MSRNIRDRHSGKDGSVAGTEKTGGYDSPVIVAGIGVGAGGTKSLKQLLGKIPSGLGIAYVLVLHPGPSKKILSIRQVGKLTALEVVEAAGGMPVLADRIHVMPSGRFLSITGGRLTLHEPVQCDGMWMPIDHFLCTLAYDFRRRSCGIVLSGAGSDGTLGLSEIKAFGGRTFVEKPGSAEFPEMPQTSIDAGVADVVLAAGAMAEAIAAAAAQTQEEIRRTPANSQETKADLQDILNILRAKIGYDFSGYKPNTLVRRIRRRMALGKLALYADYAVFLQEHPEEVALLQNDLLIGVTEFFRQPQAWEILEEKIVATLVENAQPGSEIRVWVPGCSTGQEAYSLAMVLTEQVKNSGKKVGFQIFATDSDLSALAKARSGSYSKNEIGQTVSAERLKRFFERKEGRYQILKQIREQIVFAPQNLTADPPFSRLDLISCRNLLMYLEQPVQQKIIVLFHFALRNGGFLFLGTAETTGDREDLFEPISKKWRIYRRIGIGRPAGIEIPVRPMGQDQPPAGAIPIAATVTRMTLASAAQQMLLDRFAPACVMIDRKLHVLYVHGKVEDYLTFPTGELTTRIVDMAREGLRARLRGAIGKCLETKRPVSVIARVRRGEKSVPVKATVSPLRHLRETDGLLLVTFEDHLLPALKSGRKSARESDVQQLTDELKVTREELQSTIEQLESSNDQLKASNEEVTASNEELQSGNEELETSKEELQSLNEELNTINARLQEKVGELENTNNDVLNLLSSTAIATVFLDKELRVKRFTPASTRLLSLIPSDQGRPVADVLRRFSDEMLLDEARRVLAELTPLAKEVQAEDGRWYFRRITPYRTQDDRIEGVVLTFVDVSDIKQAEQALRASEKKYRDLAESANSVIIRWKPDGELTYFNRYGLSFFGYREEEILGRNVMVLIPGQESSGRDLSDLANAIVEHPEQYINNENENVLADGRRVWVQWTNKAILDEAGNVREILAIGNNITERKRAEEELRLAHLRMSWLARFPEENPNPVLRVSADGEALYCNPAAMELEGWKCEIGRPMPDPGLPLVKKAMAEGREVMQDVDLGDRTYSVAVASFPAEGYANVYGRDITKRKQAEEKLQTTVQRFYNILSGMYAAVLLVKDDGLVEFANQAFCDIFGLKESAISLNGLTSQEMIAKIKNGYLQPDEAVARIGEIVRIGEPVKGEEVAMSGGRTCLRDFIPIVIKGISYGRLWHHLDITERKQAEETLQRSRERLDLALSSSRMATFEWDIVTNKRTWSEGVHSLLGTKPENFTGAAEEFFQIIHPEDRSTVQAALARAVETTELYETEYRAVWPDDSIRYISARGKVHRDSAGRAVSMTGVCWDITERKQAEEELRRNEAMLRAVLDQMPSGVTIRDARTGALILSNAKSREIMGALVDNRDQFAQYRGFRPDGSQYRNQEWPVSRSMVTGEVVDAEEIACERRDGTRITLSISSAPVRDSQGKIVIGIGIFHDITERKRAEMALSLSEEKFSRAFAMNPAAVVLTSLEDGVFLEVNEAFLTIFGFSRDEAVGHSTLELQLWPTSEDRARRVQELREKGSYRDREQTMRRKSGEHFATLTSADIFTLGDERIILSTWLDITERKRAEEAVQQQAQLLDLSHDAIFTWDLEGAIEYWNEGAEKLYGYSRRDAVGRVSHELLCTRHPVSLDEVKEVLKRNGVWSGELSQTAKDGHEIVSETRHQLIHRDGRLIVLETNRDITERKRAEDALRESEERYRTLFSTLMEGFCIIEVIFDSDGRPVDYRFLEINPAFEAQTGLQNARGRLIRELAPDHEAHWYEIYGNVALTGQPARFVNEAKVSGGWFDVSAYRLGGPESRKVAVLFSNITERKRAEEALREARRRLEVIVDSIADGFYALDREWRFTHANDAALCHMGKTREEILGRTLFDVYPETRNSVVETEYARAMESREPCHFENPSLLTGRVLEIHAYPGSDNLTVLFRDVTEKNRMVTALRESEEALREANEHLEQRVRERTMDLQNLTEQLERSRHELRKLASELVMAEERERKRIAGVLHDDIAQTLAAVRMRLEMIQDIPSDQKDTALTDAKALLVQTIQETRALMNDLGNPLLFDMGLKPACEALASRLMERHPVRIHCDIRDTYKHLDPDMKTILYQVVRELLNNIVKHSQAQNAHVLIDMENEHYRVKVTDDGVGFEPQRLGAPTVEGGFGLYSIRERLIAVDGSLRIESAPGAGTVVTAILPATLD